MVVWTVLRRNHVDRRTARTQSDSMVALVVVAVVALSSQQFRVAVPVQSIRPAVMNPHPSEDRRNQKGSARWLCVDLLLVLRVLPLL